MTCASGIDMNVSKCDSRIPSMSIFPSKPSEFFFFENVPYLVTTKSNMLHLIGATATT